MHNVTGYKLISREHFAALPPESFSEILTDEDYRSITLPCDPMPNDKEQGTSGVSA
jgi:hypothetical protein